MKNIIILAKTEEQMQGIIRGIEQLDTNHEIGIIYGSFTDREVSEVTKVLIDVAEATVVHTGVIKEDAQYKMYQLNNIPTDDRNNVIDYIINNHKGIIKDLIS